MSTEPTDANFNPERNVMTISWLTPMNNNGTIILSMNQKRHTAKHIVVGAQFVLNIAVEGHEDLLKRVGGCSGANVRKCVELPLPTCHVGWLSGPASPRARKQDDPSHDEWEDVFALYDCPAHIQLVVREVNPLEGHLIIIAQTTKCWVQSTYWDGKTFGAMEESTPAHLSFLGSGMFASVRRQSEISPIFNSSVKKMKFDT